MLQILCTVSKRSADPKVLANTPFVRSKPFETVTFLNGSPIEKELHVYKYLEENLDSISPFLILFFFLIIY
jgi:hypothetical protein